MQTLNFSTGLITYSVNGQCELRFNPTDSAFVERVYHTFETLDGKQVEYQRRVEAAAGTREIFTIARELDGEMRALLDETLGTGVCAALFGAMNVYALADGLPVWSNLLLAVLDVVDAGFADERQKTDPRVAKYVSKYKKK